MQAWKNKFKHLIYGAVALSVLFGCQSMAPKRQVDVAVDGGHIHSFLMTENGALPANDGTYHVEKLGLMLYRSDNRVHYSWDVMVNVAEQLPNAVSVSQVLSDGGTKILLHDRDFSTSRGEQWQKPQLGGRSQLLVNRWRGITLGQALEAHTFLNDVTQDSMLVFKIEIEVANRPTHVLYQPMMVSQESKKAYQRVISKAMAN